MPLGLTAMADYTGPSSCSCLRSSRSVRSRTATRARPPSRGLAAGFAAVIKPSNLIFLAAPAIALLAARRWRELLVGAAALAPRVLALAIWKYRGYGYLPAFAYQETVVALGPDSLTAPYDKYVDIDWDNIGDNLASLREVFWSMRVLQWLPFAGAIAVARRSIPVALMLSVWFWAFFVLKGSSDDATVDSGAFFRFLLPAIPAFLLLAASLPLLIPKYGIELARRTALPKPRAIGRRALIAAAVVLGLSPVVAAAASSPLRGPDEVLQHIEIAVPVRGIELEATGGARRPTELVGARRGLVARLLQALPQPGGHRLPLLHGRLGRRSLHARLGRAADAAKDERGRPARARDVDVQGRRSGELGRRSRAGRRLPPLEPRHRHGSVTSRRWLGEALGLAGLLAVAALVYSRGVDAAANYDEGVYLASLDALRHGQELGTDVYASQPPGFYVLLAGAVPPAGRRRRGDAGRVRAYGAARARGRLRDRQEAGGCLGRVRSRRPCSLSRRPGPCRRLASRPTRRRWPSRSARSRWRSTPDAARGGGRRRARSPGPRSP